MRRRNSRLRPDEARAAWDAAQPSAAAAPVRVQCTLTTPMYGGGVAPGEVDRAMPIRPTAIRGQLRFWWRLLNGAGRSARDVFADESDLWGGIASAGPRASRVALHVNAEPIGSELVVDAPAYAPIVDRDANLRLLRAGYEFTLTLRFTGPSGDPSAALPRRTARRDQVIETVRWWASFGGVGARTRRGLGAVEVASDDVALPPVSREEVKSRGGRMALRAPRGNAMQAWQDSVEALKHFRQGEDMGRNRGRGGRPGRSHWPEPDAIRGLTGRYASGHKPEHAAGAQYPRAAFGLPIVFQFKDPGDPRGPKGKSLTLNPAEDHDESPKNPRRDRMASPLIVRPYFDGARYSPLALLLPAWEDRVSVPISLDSTRLGPAWPEDPKERERLADLVPPMRGRGADALTAFLDYFERSKPAGQRRGGR